MKFSLEMVAFGGRNSFFFFFGGVLLTNTDPNLRNTKVQAKNTIDDSRHSTPGFARCVSSVY